MRKKINVKFLVFSLIITTLIKLVISGVGYREWIPFGILQPGRWGTVLIYYGIWSVTMLLYLKIRREKYDWWHLLMVSFSPATFFFSFCMFRYGYFEILSFIMFLFFIICDWQIAKDELASGKRNDRKLRTRVYAHLIGDNFLKAWTYLGVLSTLTVCATSLPLTVDVIGNQYQAKQQNEVVRATNRRDLISDEIGHLWEGNKELLVELNSNRYPEKSLEERLEAWQVVVDLEAAYLGTNMPQLIASDIAKDGNAGLYDPNTETITVDVNILKEDDGQYRILRILLHECYHHYCRCAVKELSKLRKAGVDMNLLFARDIEEWEREELNYSVYDSVEGDDSYYRYASQKLELAAQEYAKEWAKDYYVFIEKIEPTVNSERWESGESEE